LKDDQGNDVYFSAGVEINTCDDEEDDDVEVKCYTVSFPVPKYTIYNYSTYTSPLFSYNLTASYFSSSLCKSYSIGSVTILGETFTQPNLYLSCGSNGQQDFSKCLTELQYLDYTSSNRYYDKSNPLYYEESENLANDVLMSFPE